MEPPLASVRMGREDRDHREVVSPEVPDKSRMAEMILLSTPIRCLRFLRRIMDRFMKVR
jgi:hypothetical protein